MNDDTLMPPRLEALAGYGHTPDHLSEWSGIPEKTVVELLDATAIRASKPLIWYGELRPRNIQLLSGPAIIALMSKLLMDAATRLSLEDLVASTTQFLTDLAHARLNDAEAVAGPQRIVDELGDAIPHDGPLDTAELGNACSFAVANAVSRPATAARLAMTLTRGALASGHVRHILEWETHALAEIEDALLAAIGGTHLGLDDIHHDWRTARESLAHSLQTVTEPAGAPDLLSFAFWDDEIKLERDLPDYALLAVVMREAERAQRAIPAQHLEPVSGALKKLVSICVNGQGDLLPMVADHLTDAAEKFLCDTGAAGLVARSVFGLGRTTRMVWADEYQLADVHARIAIQAGESAAAIAGLTPTSTAREDIEKLISSGWLRRDPRRYGIDKRRQRRPFDFRALR